MNIPSSSWKVEGEGIRLYIDPFLNLHKTLDCGQCFRWRYSDGSWQGIVGDRFVTLREDASGWLLTPCTEEAFLTFWRTYLDLDRDYEKIEARYQGLDSQLDTALDMGRGIHILRQPFWETTVSFVLSANNNIPRIQGMIQRLCQTAGPALPAGDWGFPGPEAVARLSEGELRALGFGYRAPFIAKLSQGFVSGRWQEAEFLKGDTLEVRKKLLELPGVGPKVADCILLFGLGRLDVFPVDTWIRKTLDTLDQGKPEDQRIMSCMANSERCGTMGYVQQVLFFAARYQKWGN